MLLADGEVAWSWPPDAEVKLAMMPAYRASDVASHHADDGGYQARHTGEIAK